MKVAGKPQNQGGGQGTLQPAVWGNAETSVLGWARSGEGTARAGVAGRQSGQQEDN